MSTNRNRKGREDLVTESRPDTRRMAAVFREFAGAFSHLEDFRGFFRCLESSLDRAKLFQEATLRLVEDADAAADAGAGGLFMPVHSSAAENLLVLRGRPSRTFGAEDLHLLASLGDLIASMSIQSQKMNALKQKASILEVLLGKLPVGVIVCTADRRVLSWNQRATEFLGESVDAGGSFENDVFQGACSEKGALRDHSFSFSVGRRLLYVECRHALGAEGDKGTLVYVIADLSDDLREFDECFSKEFYRCLWLGQPLSLISVRWDNHSAGVMKVLALVRERAGTEFYAGVRSGDTIGVVVPGKEKVEASRLLRTIMKELDLDGLRVCVVGVGDNEREPNEMLSRTEVGFVPVASWMRRSILVFDGSQDVTDTLGYVLSDEYRVVKFNQFGRAVESVRSDVFDGLIAEIEARDGSSGIELARYACRFHPGIRTFLTTTGRSGEAVAGAHRFGERPVVIEKPFQVSALREKIRAGFE